MDDSGDPGCTNACTSSPAGRTVASMAYDPASGQMVLFGGGPAYATDGQFNDTWNWNGRTWKQVGDSGDRGCSTTCTSSPPGRTGAVLDFDPGLGRLVLFGGFGDYPTEFNDTWTWNGSTWNQVADNSDPGCASNCSSSPPIRSVATMANDPKTNQLVLFGGQGDLDTNTWLNDTWALYSGPV